MKQITIAIFAILALASCQKKRCYQCTMTQYGAGTTYRATTTVCGMTDDDKRKYEQSGTTTATATSGGYTATVSTVTTCN